MIQPFISYSAVLFWSGVPTFASGFWQERDSAFLTSDLPNSALETPYRASPLSPEAESIESAKRIRELAGKK